MTGRRAPGFLPEEGDSGICEKLCVSDYPFWNQFVALCIA